MYLRILVYIMVCAIVCVAASLENFLSVIILCYIIFLHSEHSVMACTMYMYILHVRIILYIDELTLEYVYCTQNAMSMACHQWCTAYYDCMVIYSL